MYSIWSNVMIFCCYGFLYLWVLKFKSTKNEMKRKAAAWSYSLGLAWRPSDWQEFKATVRSHTAGHTIYPVRDEPHPHREAINGPRRAGSPVASSPIRCAFHRFKWSFVPKASYIFASRNWERWSENRVITLIVTYSFIFYPCSQ